MAKPKWMNRAEQEARSGDYERLEPGGHKCNIRMIEPTKSKSGLDMYVIYFDTSSEDAQPYYYKKAFDSDTRDEKVWNGRMWLIVDENASSKDSYYGRTNLAKLTTAIEDSGDFQTDWKADYRTQEFCRQFAGRKVGIVFREEEYNTVNGEVRVSVKPVYFRNYDKVTEAKVPKRKELPQTWTPAAGTNGSEGFMQLSDALEDEGLPFNV